MTDNKIKEILYKKLIDKIQEKEKIKRDIELYKYELKQYIKNLVENMKYDEALELISMYKKVLKDDTEILSIEGVIYIQCDELESAYKVLNEALEIDSDNVDLLYNMAYLQECINNYGEAIFLYEKCYKNSNDKILKQEVDNILNQLILKDRMENSVFINLNNKNSRIISNLNNKSDRVINIIENNELQYEKRYYENDIETYEVNSNQYLDILKFISRKYKYTNVIFSDTSKIKELKGEKELFKLIYYTDNNIYIDKTDYINLNLNIYDEIQLLDEVDIIITDNIKVYNYKKILEKRNNVYYFEDYKTKNKYVDLELYNILIYGGYINDEGIIFKEVLKNIDKEYEKSYYLLASELSNIENCIQITEYIYDKYKTEEMYNLYLNMLTKQKDIYKLSNVAINSTFCDDIFKAEIMYVASLDNMDILSFLINLSTKNYRYMDDISSDNYCYKVANYNYFLNQFEFSYEKYIELLNEDNILINSPMVNRNIGYLKYIKGRPDYVDFYENYKELMKCLDE